MNSKEIEKKALDNLARFKEIMKELERICKEDGISLEEGIRLLDTLRDNKL